MKAYEDVHRVKLTDRCPKVIRLDGKAFHTYTAKLPAHDAAIPMAMHMATEALMKEMGGVARMAYVQSDECSIVMNDCLTLQSQPWFDNKLQKLTSVAASIFTAHFNSAVKVVPNVLGTGVLDVPQYAYFDARVIQLPDINELTNYLIWRQVDAIRNSIQMCAQERFSHTELHKKSVKDMLAMMKDKGFDWEAQTPGIKYGFVIDKTKYAKYPVFKEDRNFVMERYLPEKAEEPEASNPSPNANTE